MKKLFIILMAGVLSVFMAASAWGKVMSFDIYTVDVPTGWKVSDDNGTVTLVSPDKACVLIITAGLSVHAHKKHVAPIVAEYGNITRAYPEQNVTVTRIHGIRVVVTILGDHRDRVPLYYSINLKDDNHTIPYR